MRFPAVAYLALSTAWAATVSAQVVVDGTTSTTVTLGADGAVTVGVAPAPNRDSVSLNRYQSFNVPEAGVNLDNRTTAARTIVNEVTGTGDTMIEGPVEVLGQRAHIIVANPNGIVIDNGRFINTGRVALTTGALGSVSQQIAPGIFQDNVTATVTGGRITVEGGGLSGQMDSIDLIANDIRINGPITNSNTNEGAAIRLYGGSNTVEFDSAVLVGNTSLNWGRVTAGNKSVEGVLVEIGDNGLLEGGAIEILVNDTGAGVRYAGAGKATASSFVLQSNGQVEITSANITAKDAFVIQSAAAMVTDSTLTATEGVLQLLSQDDMSFGNSTLTAAQMAFQSDTKLSFDTVTVASKLGDISARGGSGIELSNSTLTSAASFIAVTDEKLTFDNAQSTAFAHAVLEARDLSLDTSTVEATNGALLAEMSGDLNSTASTLQGGTLGVEVGTTKGVASKGAVTLDIGGDFTNVSGDDRSVVFGLAGGVHIKTGGAITNDRGRILANGDISLIAEGDVVNLLPSGPLAVAPEVESFSEKGRRVWWTLWLKQERKAGSVYDYGTLENTEDVPIVNATLGLTIDAANVRNIGGELSASGGDLTINAATIETIGLGSGRIEVETICTIGCKATGSGEVIFAGGRLNASGDARLSATTSLINTSGQIFASNNVEITAPDVTVEAALVPTLVKRPSGLYNFWKGKDAWVLLRDQFGTIIAETGSITIASDNPIKLIGGALTAADTIDLSSGEDIVRAPQTTNQFRQRKIGWLADWPFVRD